ncbi:DoxX family protein [Terrabacter sp. BE26]|uniref:DoxX family protein n=1 Tax=Terrabacter sp. BE26 TaxID=2898152 RepID=UPI0035BE5347
MKIGRLAARVVIGGLFVGHGTQKLFGWFGGPGLEGTEQMMGALKMQPARANAIAAGVSETVGGALLVVGAATPLAASSLIGTMLTAIWKVHKPQGVWVTQGGWEYNAVLIASLVALMDAGPGEVSVDAALGHEEWGPGWALGGLALGAAASSAAIALGRRASSPAEAAQEAAAGQSQVGRAATGDTPGDPVTAVSND